MRFLLSVYRPIDFNHAQVITPQVMADIDQVNDEMEVAGVRVFVGGLRPLTSVKSVVRSEEGTVTTVDGPAEEETRFLDGLWVLEVENESEALKWGQKTAAACRATIEVRPFY